MGNSEFSAADPGAGTEGHGVGSSANGQQQPVGNFYAQLMKGLLKFLIEVFHVHSSRSERAAMSSCTVWWSPAFRASPTPFSYHALACFFPPCLSQSLPR